MPTHTTIDHLDDALQRLAKAERVCAGLQESYLHVCDQNAVLRARVAELEKSIADMMASIARTAQWEPVQ